MAPQISLALAIHNHQPVGNFGWVLEEVFEQAYGPMVDALERHPAVRLSLHYTGALLEWLRAERPEFVARLVALVDRGQVELLGGGLYEPVLASLPARDRVAQLVRMADALERLTGRRPRGAWLAERVWEPDLPTALTAAGYGWTVLDDAHFRAAGVPEENLWGTYVTEDQGHRLTVFGTEQGLRYRIPFGEVDDVIAYLREHATPDGSRVGVMGDDGEKFGAWPTTWEHCWGRGRWVDRFFEALTANADWLTTVTPSEWLDRTPPIGRVYVPTSSYAEMGEWSLPYEEGRRFTDLLHRAVEERRPEARWLRGGFWRNFQVKYREVNDLHKQMLRASDLVEAMPDGPARDRAVDHLHRGQSNDCYWHGLFGGIYIGHMRLATWEHLIAAEDLALASEDAGRGTAELTDVDLDGRDEVLLVQPGQVVTVDLDEGAGIGRWDIRAAWHAATAVMRRRPEAYHDRLKEATTGAGPQPDEPVGGDGIGGADEAVASIHEIVRMKEEGLAGRLQYDAWERRSALVRVLPPDADAATWVSASEADLLGPVDAPWTVDALEPGRVVVMRQVAVPDSAARANGATVHLEKEIELTGGRRDPGLGVRLTVVNSGAVPLDARLGLEWATNMLGGGGNPAAWWEAGETRSPHDAAGRAGDVDRIAQGNDHVGVAITTSAEPPATAWWAPIDTVSNSESGFERIYQGSALLLSWRVLVGPGETWTAHVRHAVSTSRDRREEEESAESGRGSSVRGASAPATR